MQLHATKSGSLGIIQVRLKLTVVWTAQYLLGLTPLGLLQWALVSLTFVHTALKAGEGGGRGATMA